MIDVVDASSIPAKSVVSIVFFSRSGWLWVAIAIQKSAFKDGNFGNLSEQPDEMAGIVCAWPIMKYVPCVRMQKEIIQP